MAQVTINNLTKSTIPENELKSLINFAIAEENLTNVHFSVVFIDDEKMRNLNTQYRQKEQTTDVLAFALEDDAQFPTKDIRLLGDVYISIPQAKKQAAEQNHSLQKELAFLMIHGFYHLLGYCHENEKDKKIMLQKQKEVLDKYGIT